jgi:hypothetical protein
MLLAVAAALPTSSRSRAVALAALGDEDLETVEMKQPKHQQQRLQALEKNTQEEEKKKAAAAAAAAARLPLEKKTQKEEEVPEHEIEITELKQFAECPEEQCPRARIENIGYLGKGYNALYGYPWPKNGGIDQGFKRNGGAGIFQIIYESDPVRETVDGRQEVPDNVQVIAAHGCSLQMTTVSANSELAFQKTISESATYEGSAGFKMFEVGGKASTEYKNFQEARMKRNVDYVFSYAMCDVFRASLDKYAGRPKFTEDFILMGLMLKRLIIGSTDADPLTPERLKKLSTKQAKRLRSAEGLREKAQNAQTGATTTNYRAASDLHELIEATFFDMFDKFGTHYSTDMTFGSMFCLTQIYSEEELHTERELYDHVGGSASFGVSGKMGNVLGKLGLGNAMLDKEETADAREKCPSKTAMGACKGKSGAAKRKCIQNTEAEENDARCSKQQDDFTQQALGGMMAHLDSVNGLLSQLDEFEDWSAEMEGSMHVTKEYKMKIRQKDSSESREIISIGAPPNEDAYEWAQKAGTEAMPIKYSLMPICDLFDATDDNLVPHQQVQKAFGINKQNSKKIVDECYAALMQGYCPRRVRKREPDVTCENPEGTRQKHTCESDDDCNVGSGKFYECADGVCILPYTRVTDLIVVGTEWPGTFPGEGGLDPAKEADIPSCPEGFEEVKMHGTEDAAFLGCPKMPTAYADEIGGFARYDIPGVSDTVCDTMGFQKLCMKKRSSAEDTTSEGVCSIFLTGDKPLMPGRIESAQRVHMDNPWESMSNHYWEWTGTHSRSGAHFTDDRYSSASFLGGHKHLYMERHSCEMYREVLDYKPQKRDAKLDKDCEKFCNKDNSDWTRTIVIGQEPCKWPKPSPPVTTGSKVMADFGGDNTWHPARIVHASLDGTFDVKYDSGDHQDLVSPDKIRPMHIVPREGDDGYHSLSKVFKGAGGDRLVAGSANDPCRSCHLEGGVCMGPTPEDVPSAVEKITCAFTPYEECDVTMAPLSLAEEGLNMVCNEGATKVGSDVSGFCTCEYTHEQDIYSSTDYETRMENHGRSYLSIREGEMLTTHKNLASFKTRDFFCGHEPFSCYDYCASTKITPAITDIVAVNDKTKCPDNYRLVRSNSAAVMGGRYNPDLYEVVSNNVAEAGKRFTEEELYLCVTHDFKRDYQVARSTGGHDSGTGEETVRTGDDLERADGKEYPHLASARRQLKKSAATDHQYAGTHDPRRTTAALMLFAKHGAPQDHQFGDSDLAVDELADVIAKAVELHAPHVVQGRVPFGRRSAARADADEPMPMSFLQMVSAIEVGDDWRARSRFERDGETSEVAELSNQWATSNELPLWSKSGKSKITKILKSQVAKCPDAQCPRSKVVNLGYIGKGYNLIYAHPAPSRSGIDPGYTRFGGAVIFDLVYGPSERPKETADGRHEIPVSLEVVSEHACSLGFSSVVLEDEVELQESLSRGYGGGASASIGPLASASFKSSNDYQEESKEMSSAQTNWVYSRATCAAYSALLTDDPDQRAPFSAEFKAASAYLKATEKSTMSREAKASAWHDFFDHFGTHYQSQILLGSKYTMKQLVMKDTWNSAMSDSKKKSVSGSMAVNAIVFSVSSSFEENEGLETGSTNNAAVESKESRYSTIGAPPMRDELEWATESVVDAMPLEQSLAEICDLFGDGPMQIGYDEASDAQGERTGGAAMYEACKRELSFDSYCKKRVGGREGGSMQICAEIARLRRSHSCTVDQDCGAHSSDKSKRNYQCLAGVCTLAYRRVVDLHLAFQTPCKDLPATNMCPGGFTRDTKCEIQHWDYNDPKQRPCDTEPVCEIGYEKVKKLSPSGEDLGAANLNEWLPALPKHKDEYTVHVCMRKADSIRGSGLPSSVEHLQDHGHTPVAHRNIKLSNFFESFTQGAAPSLGWGFPVCSAFLSRASSGSGLGYEDYYLDREQRSAENSVDTQPDCKTDWKMNQWAACGKANTKHGLARVQGVLGCVQRAPGEMNQKHITRARFSERLKKDMLLDGPAGNQEIKEQFEDAWKVQKQQEWVDLVESIGGDTKAEREAEALKEWKKKMYILPQDIDVTYQEGPLSDINMHGVDCRERRFMAFDMALAPKIYERDPECGLGSKEDSKNYTEKHKFNESKKKWMFRSQTKHDCGLTIVNHKTPLRCGRYVEQRSPQNALGSQEDGQTQFYTSMHTLDWQGADRSEQRESRMLYQFGYSNILKGEDQLIQFGEGIWWGQTKEWGPHTRVERRTTGFQQECLENGGPVPKHIWFQSTGCEQMMVPLKCGFFTKVDCHDLSKELDVIACDDQNNVGTIAENEGGYCTCIDDSNNKKKGDQGYYVTQTTNFLCNAHPETSCQEYCRSRNPLPAVTDMVMVSSADFDGAEPICPGGYKEVQSVAPGETGINADLNQGADKNHFPKLKLCQSYEIINGWNSYA